MRAPFVVLASLFAASSAWADGTLVTYTENQEGQHGAYVEYLPPGYTGGTGPEALVLMFHGKSETGAGTDAAAVYAAMTKYGPLWIIKDALARGVPHRFESTHRAIVLGPRNPPTSSGLWSTTAMLAFFDYALARYRVDPQRIYLTGVSAGGKPCWNIPPARDDKVAAVLPICPVHGGATAAANGAWAFHDIPVWAFHGFGDTTVPRAESIGWVDQIARVRSGDPAFPTVMTGYPHASGDPAQSAGVDETALYEPPGWDWQPGRIGTGPSPLRYTLLPTTSHVIWQPIYLANATWDWLFAQRRLPAGAADAGVPDAGKADAGRPDAGRPDASLSSDAGRPDSGSPRPDAAAPRPDAAAAQDAAADEPDAAAIDSGDAADLPGEDAGAAEPPDAQAVAEGDAEALEPADAEETYPDPPDTGEEPPPDAQVAGRDAAAVGPGEVESGCGCTATPGAVEGMGLLALALSVALTRRRRPR